MARLYTATFLTDYVIIIILILICCSLFLLPLSHTQIVCFRFRQRHTCHITFTWMLSVSIGSTRTCSSHVQSPFFQHPFGNGRPKSTPWLEYSNDWITFQAIFRHSWIHLMIMTCTNILIKISWNTVRFLAVRSN